MVTKLALQEIKHRKIAQKIHAMYTQSYTIKVIEYFKPQNRDQELNKSCMNILSYPFQIELDL